MGRAARHPRGSSQWTHGHYLPRVRRSRVSGSRIDAVLVSGPAVFPIEFKCGESQFRLADCNQAWDYALDLKNFHAASHDAAIFPILVATQAEVADNAWQPAYPDGVRRPYRCGAPHLRDLLREGLAQSSGPEIDAEAWGAAPYQPTPTIIEAARAVFVLEDAPEFASDLPTEEVDGRA